MKPVPNNSGRPKIAALQWFCVLSLLLFNLSACAQYKITASITVTNKTTNGMTFTLNGDTRTFITNVVNAATQVATNADTTGVGSKTNLLTQIRTTPFSQTRVVDVASNAFSIIGNADLPMALTLSAGYASVSYSTQTVADLVVANVPVSALPTAAARTNVASGIVGAVNATENTNAISQISTAASELMGKTNAQTISGAKTFTNAASKFFGVVSNSPAISGTVIALIGGVFTTPFLSAATLTNSLNYGTYGFSSPGSGTFSEQFGHLAQSPGAISTALGSEAYAFGDYSTALGASASADGFGSTSVGQSSTASGPSSAAVGTSAQATGTNSTAVGTSSYASAYAASSFGYLANSQFTNSTAIGANATTTAPNQVMLGAPGISTTVQNDLTVQGVLSVTGNTTISGSVSILGAQNNQAFSGTNNFLANADFAFTRKIISSLASGNNAAVPIGTNVFVEVSGPSAAFTINGMANGRDGKLIVLLNQSGQVMTIANESGVDATPGNRIRTLTGADLATAANSICTFIYSGSAGRWILLSAGTVSTVTNVNASQITGLIPASQIATPITFTNFVLNQLYTNTASAVMVRGSSLLLMGAADGWVGLDAMLSTNSGSSFFQVDGVKMTTSILNPTNSIRAGFTLGVQTNGVYYFTNSSSGSGNAASIVSGTGQVIGL